MSDTSASLAHDQLKNRAQRLLTFLREVVALRTKMIRSLETYEKVLWLADVPHEPECHFIGWTAPTADDPDRTWVEVKKPKLLAPPVLPSELEDWVNPHHLRDSGKEPTIYERILATADNDELWEETSQIDEDEVDQESRFIELQDHPEIRSLWETYLAGKWRPWAENDARKQRVQRLYTDLYTFYQQQKELGESYEVVLCLGQLRWRVSSGHDVNRHLIVAQIGLEFDSVRGVITVGPAPEGTAPRLEQDMLEQSDRPPAEVQAAIEKNVASVEDDIWHNESIMASLMSWANSAADGHGDFTDTLTPIDTALAIPKIAPAPAIILRRRTERGYLQLYSTIIESLKNRSDMPSGLGPLVDINWHDHDTTTVPDLLSSSARHSPSEHDGELYFPLPSNEQQREILGTLTTERGLVVQGPPGTGKSHTIANLVSHLLAEGKRVLVTSQTPRALRVLKEKIPSAISELCVVLLGHDQSSFKELEGSVHGITQRLNTWTPKTEADAVDRLEAELHAIRSEAAKTDGELRSIREADTRQHPPMNGGYSGTLQKIAAELSQRESELGWIQDYVTDDLELPSTPGISTAETRELITLLQKHDSDRKLELTQSFPSLEEVPTPDSVEALIASEEDAQREWAEQGRLSDTDPLPSADTDILREFLAVLDSCLAQNAELESHILPFTEKLAVDVRSEQDQSWWALKDQTEKCLAAIQQHAEHIADLRVSGHGDVDLATLREDAKALLEHLESGGKLKHLFRYTSLVRERRYIVEQVTVGGKSAITTDALRNLVAWADIRFNHAKLQGLWTGIVETPQGDLSRQLAAYRDFCEPLDAAKDLYNNITRARELSAEIEGLPPVSWHDLNAIEETRSRIQREVLHRDLLTHKQQLQDLEDGLRSQSTQPQSHEIVDRLAHSIANRNGSAYRAAYVELENLLSDRQELERRNALLAEFQGAIPKLAHALSSGEDLSVWHDRLSVLEEAWNWLCVDRWLRNQVDPSYYERLVVKSKQLQQRERDTVTALTAVKAWIHCMERMNSSQETYLKGWMAAVSKIGAGTGKRAAKFRRVARDYMRECRQAIPAWIMPLYRVVESVTPSENVFDVAIIDEASQSGPEALFLHYIAKKVVVVGDDKQIAPEHIGVKRDEVELLRKRYIADLPLADHYDLESSFFEQASLRFRSRIRLTEHFRCMPEIIQFSNNLCYQNEPLIPLRQYGDERLDPVRTTYVPEGYTKGYKSDYVNPSEAEAIVDQIEECCQDPRYDGKTMGVVSLLGSHQARLIESNLLKRIGPEEMERRRLVCGDAYAFQGDERHVMFLSLVVAPDRRFQTLTGNRYRRRFNVAASRAQDQMWLFHSVTLDELGKSCIRRQLVSYCQDPKPEQDMVGSLNISDIEYLAATADRTERPPNPFDSWFEVDMFLRIHRRGYRVLPQYAVAGYRIDLVVAGMKERVAVECDGEQWHGAEQYEHDSARQRQLERCGWQFWRIRGGTFYRSPEESLEPLWEFLDRNGVHPCCDDGTQKDRNTGESSEPQDDNQMDAHNGYADQEEFELIPRRGVEVDGDDQELGDDDLSDEDRDLNESPQRASTMESARDGFNDAPVSSTTLFPEEEQTLHCPDPRTGNPRQIRDALVKVVQKSGPMPCHYAYELYRRQCGAGRLSKPMRSVLNRAMAAACRKGDLIEENEYGSRDQINRIMRGSDTPRVHVRPRGDRRLDQIAPSEIAAVMQEITNREHAIGRLSQDYLFRKVLEYYGLIRLTANAKSILAVAYEIYRKTLSDREDTASE